MQKRRTLALVLALLMLLTLLTACGGEKETEQTKAPQENVTPGSEAPTPDEPGPEDQPEDEAFTYPIAGENELTVWRTLSAMETNVTGGEVTAGQKKLEELTGVHIEYMLSTDATASAQLGAMFAGGDYPDIMSAVEQFYPRGLALMCDEGISLELTEIINDYMPNYARERLTSEVYTKDTVADDGNIYGIYILTVSENIPQGPAIRGDWLEDLGLEIPKTYEDYENVLRAFKTEKGATAGLHLTNYGMPYYNYLCAGYDVAAYVSDARDYKPFFQIDGTVKYGPLEQGWYDFTEMMTRWYKEGLVYQDFMSQTAQTMTPTIVELGTTGKSGLLYTYQFQLSTIPMQSDDPNCELIPIGDAVKEVGQQLHLRAPITLIQRQGSVITTGCENVELAARWMDFGLTDEGYMLASYGIEDKENGSYYIDEGGDVVYTEYLMNMAEENGYDRNSQLLLFTANTLCYHQNLDLQTFDPEMSIKANAAWTEYADDTYWMPSGMTLTAEENEEFATLWADIRTLTNEFYMSVITGALDLETEYDKFVSDLHGRDIDRCIDIYQQALDRYNSR